MDKTMSGEKDLIKKIFDEIDSAIETTKSNKPVKIKYSKFLKLYNKIKKKYLNDTKIHKK